MALTTPRLRVLVVDDEENIRHLLSLVLDRAGYTVTGASTGTRALELLHDADIVLCDVRMPDMDGLAFLRHLPANAPPVVMMSAYGTLDVALMSLRLGASDYVAKPFKTDEVLLTLKKLEHRQRLTAPQVGASAPPRALVGENPAFRDALRLAERLAPLGTPVALRGEPGTGRRTLARELHRRSPLREAPFVVVDCRTEALPAAPSGTLALVEPAEGPQEPLLALGAACLAAPTRPPRLVVITTGPIPAPLARVEPVIIDLPPLRARAEDLPLLIEHLLDRLAPELRLPRPAIGEAARRRLLAHAWPGNVGELHAALRHALLTCRGAVDEHDLPASLRSAEEDLSIPVHTRRLERDLIQRALQRHAGNKAAAARALDVSYKTLLYKIREYEEEDP